MKEYIFYQVGAIMLYQQLQFICSPISAIDTLMTEAEFTKISIYQATA